VLKFAICIGGENSCPPEDCGGVRSYSELLEDGELDLVDFDLAAANAMLQQLG